jgi:hypothetical protein
MTQQRGGYLTAHLTRHMILHIGNQVKARKCQAKKNRNANGKKTESERTFRPTEYREEIVALVERHLRAHPLIPDNHGGNPKAIHYWATKKIYQHCVDNELVDVWAYLWVNWYRPSRWRLGAQAKLLASRQLCSVKASK